YYVDYMQRGLGQELPPVPTNGIIERMMDSGAAVVGTPDDLIAAIERCQETTGGFGTLLVRVHEWTIWDKTRYSYELLARYVMPRFQDSLHGLEASYQAARDHVDDLRTARKAAIDKAHEDYLATAGRGG